MKQMPWILGLLVLSQVACADQAASDISIVGGHVIDACTRTDRVATVTIRGDRVEIVDGAAGAGRTMNATGLIVSRGFIDPHSHGVNPENNCYQAFDGVTTTMELEIGTGDVGQWYRQREGKSVLNYGVSASHPLIRASMFGEQGLGAGSRDWALTQEQLAAMLDLISAQVRDGAIGIGIGLAYTPGATAYEILKVFELAAELGVPVFIHVRQAAQLGDPLAPLQEVLADALVSGAHVHIAHLNSTFPANAPTALDMIRSARQRGVRVSTEMYPYTAGATRIESAIFDDWHGDYANLQWVKTGERLDADSFAKAREEGGWVVMHGRSMEETEWLAAQPDVVIASDTIPFVNGFSHPRSVGTFSKILRLGREHGLPLKQILSRMNQQTADVLGLPVDCAADIVVFDDRTITDRATYTEPGRVSGGVKALIVSGQPVIWEGRYQEGTFPGRPIRRSRLNRDGR